MLLSELIHDLRQQLTARGNVEVVIYCRSSGVICDVDEVDYDQFDVDGPEFVVLETNENERT